MGKSLAFFLDPDELQPHRRKRNIKIRGGTGCVGCPGSLKAKSPRMEPFGSGQKRILLMGESPGRTEDDAGIQFVGPSGQFLGEALSLYGIDMGRDCVRQNVVQCFIPDSDKKKLLGKCQKRCSARVHDQIQKISPKLVLTLGGPASKAVLEPPSGVGWRVGKVRGRAIPCRRHNCWVGCLLHPAFVVSFIKL